MGDKVMSSLFSGPKINTAGVRTQLKKGQKAAKNLKPININAGGLTSSLNDNSLSINSDANRQGLVTQGANLFTQQADQLGALRGQIAPGTSALRAAQLAEIENARQASISNLRDNLARRRVLGSSFGSDALTRSNLDFEQQKSKVIADTYMKELDATNQLINQEFTARQSAVTTQVSELNLQADLGQSLIASATDALKASAQLQAQLASSGASTLGGIASNQATLDAGAQGGVGNLLGYVGGKLLGPSLDVAGAAIAA
jgi:hypothetical protein